MLRLAVLSRLPMRKMSSSRPISGDRSEGFAKTTTLIKLLAVGLHKKRASFESPRRVFRAGFMGLIALFMPLHQVQAGEARIAVATNFLLPARALAERFEATTGHQITLIAGSSGKLAAQIERGAPFDAFLSADSARPLWLVESGIALAESRFVYATGILVLWTPDAGRIGWRGEPHLVDILRDCCKRIAIANPALAPYGLAAEQTIAALGLRESLDKRLAMGENVGQAFGMIATGNAEIGLIALAQLTAEHLDPESAHMEIPPDLHDPIRQEAVLLRYGIDNPAAKAFLEYLRQPETRERIAEFGYRSE